MSSQHNPDLMSSRFDTIYSKTSYDDLNSP